MKTSNKQVKEVLKKRTKDLSFTEFQTKFPDEESCWDYLFTRRWPNGFYCSKCGHTHCYFVKSRHVYQCAKCKKQHSVMAGTIFQDAHVSIQKWFWAIYLVSRDKRGYSAIGLKNAINVSYPTAWLMLQKIRIAMANKDNDYILKGTVVVDDAFFGGVVEDKKRGRGTEQVNVLVTISLTEDQENPLFAKMSVIEDMKSKTVSEVIKKMVEPGSTLRSDAHKTLVNLEDFQHEVVIASQDKERAKKFLHWVDTVISNAKSYIQGTYHGLPKRYLQRYLDEFCFRLNRRFCEPIIFDKLLNACLIFHPILDVSSL